MIPKFLDILTRIEKALASVLVFALTIFVVMDVASRELYKTGIPWAQKGAVYMMIWVGFLGAIIVTHKVEHLRPEIADKLWQGKSKIFYLRAHNFLVFCFASAMAYYSVLYVLESKEFGDRNIIIDLPMWALQAVIPYAFISMSLRYFYFIFSPKEKDPGAVH
jgi:TRAP-type C4-dicarboxylate transport system permease small subunit